MKSWVPNSIKFPFWWIFKSPQRSLGWYTLKNDLIGLGIQFKTRISKANPKPISICVGLFNRQEIFLKYFIPSLANCDNLDKIELSIVVCGNEDLAEFERQIKMVYTGKLLIQKTEQTFTRACTLNLAVKQSSHEILFLCDADFSIPKEIVQLCANNTFSNACWFPIVFYLYKNKPPIYSSKNGEWMIWGGKGLLCMNRTQYANLGGLDEKFITWGGEDEDFWMRAHKASYIVIRSHEKGLLHHWHPSLNAKYKKLEELSDMGLL
ncbi:MAG: hypothetical protein CFE21_12705 [Bacteroidetes bacterium B1(2017)]|nr:MAG: hypothetical protein CFE21_12705 [Bacteroidetes bacterium B1(2017)]